VIRTTAQTIALWQISTMAHDLQHTTGMREQTRNLSSPLGELLAQQKALLEAWGQLSDEQAWEYTEQQLIRIQELLRAVSGPEN